MQLTDAEVAIWFHYEEIAMHFNQLIMQYRLQLMGGFGAIGAISSYLVGGKVTDEGRRIWLRCLIATGLLVLVIAAAILDVFYYNLLLQGAVDALIEFESQHPPLNMSTLIERKVAHRGLYTIYFVYSAVIGTLAAFTIWSWMEHKAKR